MKTIRQFLLVYLSPRTLPQVEYRSDSESGPAYALGLVDLSVCNAFELVSETLYDKGYSGC